MAKTVIDPTAHTRYDLRYVPRAGAVSGYFLLSINGGAEEQIFSVNLTSASYDLDLEGTAKLCVTYEDDASSPPKRKRNGTGGVGVWA